MYSIVPEPYMILNKYNKIRKTSPDSELKFFAIANAFSCSEKIPQLWKGGTLIWKVHKQIKN